MTLRLRFVALGMLGVASCATPGQVRRIETQLMMQDREQERRDSTFQAVLAAILRQNDLLLDSLANTKAAIAAAKGQSSADLIDLQRRLQGLEESQRMSNRQISEWMAEMDRQQTARAAARLPEGDSLAVDGAAGEAGAGQVATASQMLQAGNAQLSRSAWSTARAAFQELLNTHPLSSLVPDALYGIAQSYAVTNPDSANAYYRDVAENHAASPRAAQAMFKLGDLAQRGGDVATARRWYERIVVDRYRGTAEYDLAESRLRQLP